MANRRKPHLGRALDGKPERPYESLEYDGTDPEGTGGVADTVDIDGTRSTTGINGVPDANRIQKLIDNDRACVDRFRNPDAGPTGQH